MPSGANIFGWLTSDSEMRSTTWTTRLDDDDWWLDLHFTDADTPIVRAWNYDHGDWYDNRSALPGVIRSAARIPTLSQMQWSSYTGQLRSWYSDNVRIYNPPSAGRDSMLFIRLPIQVVIGLQYANYPPPGTYGLWGCLIQEGESLDDWYLLCMFSTATLSSRLRSRTVRLDSKMRTSGLWRDADNNWYISCRMGNGPAAAMFRSSFNRSVDLMSMENYLKYSGIIDFIGGTTVNVPPVESPVVHVAAPTVNNEVKVDGGGGGGIGRSTGAFPPMAPMWDSDPITGEWVQIDEQNHEFGTHVVAYALTERSSEYEVLEGYPPIVGGSLVSAGRQFVNPGVWGRMIGRSDGASNVANWWASTPNWAKTTALGITLTAAASDITARILETDLATELRGQEEYGIYVGNERAGFELTPIKWTHKLVRLWSFGEAAAPIARNPSGALNVASALLDGFEGYESGTYTVNVGTFQQGLNSDGYRFIADVITDHGTAEQKAQLMNATSLGAVGGIALGATALGGIVSADDPRAEAAKYTGITDVASLGSGPDPGRPRDNSKGRSVPPIVGKPTLGGNISLKTETPPEIQDRDILRELEEEGVDTKCIDLAREALDKGATITYDTFRDKECFEAWQRIKRR